MNHLYYAIATSSYTPTILSADDYRYLYAKLESSKIPGHIHAKIMDGDDLTSEEEQIIKEIIAKDRRDKNEY